MNDEQRIKEIRNYQEWLVNNVYVFRYGRMDDGTVCLESPGGCLADEPLEGV